MEENNNSNIYDSNMNLNYIPVENNTEPIKPKKSKKTVFILIAILAVIIIAIAFGLIYFLVIAKNPKIVFKNAVTSSLHYLKNDLQINKYKTMKSDLTLKCNIEQNDLINITNEDFRELINTSSINFGTQIDNENDKVAFLAGLKNQDEEIIDAEVYLDLTNTLLDLRVKDIFDKYLETELNEDLCSSIQEFIDNDESASEYNEMIDIIEKSLLGCIKSEYCSKEKVQITIEGKKTDVTKNTIKLTSVQFYTELKSALENLLNDKEFIEKHKDLEDTLKSQIESIENSMEYISEGYIQLNLYTKGFANIPVSIELIYNDEPSTISIKVSDISENKFEINIVNNKNQILKCIVQVNQKSKDEGNFEISLDYNNNEFLTLQAVYKVTYDEPISKMENSNVMKFEELTNDDYIVVMQNFMNSKLYNTYVKVLSGEEYANVIRTLDDKYSITVNVPERFILADSPTENIKTWANANNTEIVSWIANTNKEEQYIEPNEKQYLLTQYKKSIDSNGVKKITAGDIDFEQLVFQNQEGYLEAYFWSQLDDEGNYIIIRITITDGQDNITNEELNQILSIQK